MQLFLLKLLHEAFGGRWFGRAWLRNRDDIPYLLGNDNRNNNSDTYIDLEAQPWGLLSPTLLAMSDKQKVFNEIESQLNEPSPIGPLQSPTGFVWPAISQLLPWSYVRNDNSSAAWNVFLKHLYANHANVFPDIWLGIWSGPDGWVSTNSGNVPDLHGYVGGTWYSLVTPMIDFPVSNSNPDAMMLFALERMIGLEPSVDGDGLFINATRTGGTFQAYFPLIEVNSLENSISGYYYGNNEGNLILTIALPSTVTSPTCEINTRGYPCVLDANKQVKLPISFVKGTVVVFNILF